MGCAGGPSDRVGLRPGWREGGGVVVDSYIKETGVNVPRGEGVTADFPHF